MTKIIHSPNGREITLVVKSTRAALPCRACNKPTRGHGLGRTLRFRHLPLLGKETYIEITPRRGICPDCDDSPTTTERLEWYERSSKMTKPYEQHLLFELVNSTVEYAELKPAIALLQKHKDSFTEEEKPVVEKLLLLSPKLKTAYQFSRELSGFVEGFNNKVKVSKRRCYGLASAKRLFQRLIIDTKGRERFAPSVAAF